jgi:hypothetical protein
MVIFMMKLGVADDQSATPIFWFCDTIGRSPVPVIPRQVTSQQSLRLFGRNFFYDLGGKLRGGMSTGSVGSAVVL